MSQQPISSLLERAKAFEEQLRADNFRMQMYIQNGGNAEDLSIESIDPKEEEIIALTIYAESSQNTEQS